MSRHFSTPTFFPVYSSSNIKWRNKMVYNGVVFHEFSAIEAVAQPFAWQFLLRTFISLFPRSLLHPRVRQHNVWIIEPWVAKWHGFYEQDDLPLIQATVSAKWRKLKGATSAGKIIHSAISLTINWSTAATRTTGGKAHCSHTGSDTSFLRVTVLAMMS